MTRKTGGVWFRVTNIIILLTSDVTIITIVTSTKQKKEKKNGLVTVPDTDSDGDEDCCEDIFQGLTVPQLRSHCRR